MDFDIVRAWKDAKYRQSLTSEQQALLTHHPAGTCELMDADLEAVQGSFGEAFGSNSLDNCISSLSPNSIDSCDTFAQIAGVCTTTSRENKHYQ